MDGVKARMRWSRQTINIATPAGPRPVQADAYGAWAIHIPLNEGHTVYIAWDVTHVPTGLSVGGGFPKDRARKLCQQLHKIVGDTPITGQGMPGIGFEMRRQIHAAILNAYGHDIATEAPPPLPRAGATP